MTKSNPKKYIWSRSRCRYFRTSLIDDLEGQLNDDVKALLSEHLENCSRCSSEKLAIQETLHIMSRRELPKPDEHFWADLRYLVREGIREARAVSPVSPPVPPRAWVPAVVVASLLVFFFLWWTRQPQIPEPGGSPLLTRLEKEGQRSLRILEQTWPETEDFQLAGSPKDSLVALLVAVPSSKLALEHVLIGEKIASNPDLWETIIEEQRLPERSLEILLEDLNEDQLKRLSGKLQNLMG